MTEFATTFDVGQIVHLVEKVKVNRKCLACDEELPQDKKWRWRVVEDLEITGVSLYVSENHHMEDYSFKGHRISKAIEKDLCATKEGAGALCSIRNAKLIPSKKC